MDCGSLAACDGILEWLDGAAFVYEPWMEDIPLTGTGPNYYLTSSSNRLVSTALDTNIVCQVESTKCYRGAEDSFELPTSSKITALFGRCYVL